MQKLIVELMSMVAQLKNRARFTLEVVDGLVEAISADKVGITFSPYGVSGGMSGASEPGVVAQFAYVFGELERRAKMGNRLAFIHLIGPLSVASIKLDLPSEKMDEVNNAVEAVGVDASNDFIYSIWNGVVIRGSDYGNHPNSAVEDTKKGQTALAYSRFFISNPDLPDHLYHGFKLNAYGGDTFYSSNTVEYTEYPTYGEVIDKRFAPRRADGEAPYYKRHQRKWLIR